MSELAERGHQARNLSAHDRQSRFGIAFCGYTLHEIKVVFEALPQPGEQDLVAHR
ncbi:hypothetical protein JNUCC0626_32250 [Lentzea sp. JNUCC 0626]|uniref:hypothetical protein n=1 Tax=Lentzea sp. JNUCC 0626 TaxID=3367513 RepID=UPI003748019F